MGTLKDRFVSDWKNLFPELEPPDVEFDSKATLEKEIYYLEQNINKWKFNLCRAEFILSHLYKCKKEFKLREENESNPKKPLKSLSEELYQQKFALEPLSSNNDSKKSLKSKKSLSGSMASLNETEIMSFSNSKGSFDNSPELSTFSAHKKSNSFGNSIDFEMQHPHFIEEKTQLTQPKPPTRRLTDPGNNQRVIPTEPISPPSTFPRKKKNKVEPPTRRVSLESSAQTKMVTKELRRKIQSVDCDQFDELSINDEAPPTVPVKIYATDFPPPPADLEDVENIENKVFEIESDENLNTETTKTILQPDKKEDITLTSEDIPEIKTEIKKDGWTEDRTSFKVIPYNKNAMSSISSDEDNDHIYTDINELKVVKPPLAVPEGSISEDTKLLENQEIMYENAHIKPKIEKLANVDGSDEEISVMYSPQNKKRLGSHDRQGSLFPDDLDVTHSGGEETNDSDVNVFTSSQESLHENDFDTPEIVVNEVNYDDFYDDDEHIYANVEDFITRKDSDDESLGSDHDPLSDSISIGLPSPSYREMTSDEIESLQKKIESDDDMPHSQDEYYDSDENVTKNITKHRLQRSRGHTAVVRSDTDQDKPINRNNTSPTKEKHRMEFQAEEEERDSEEMKANRMRKYLVMNLLDSEKCYYDCLDILFKFMKPLHISTKSSQPILTEQDFQAIFHEANKIHSVHKTFLCELEPRIENWNSQQLIGDLFIMIMNHFDVYYGYIGNYKTAMDTVLKCRNANQQFKDIMDQDIRIPSIKDPLKLEGLLYKPVDRLTQYSLILNDLLKYTSPDHPDHPLIVEVSGALFDLFEQVNVDSSKKKRRQRQLLKEASLVEIVDGERRTRNLILFNDVIISAKLKSSRDAFVCKWYASLSDINIKPYKNSEADQTVPVSTKAECDKLRASIANTRAEIRKEHMPLQQVVSSDANAAAPFVKRGNLLGGHARSSSRAIEKLKKKILEQESLLGLISPSIPLHLYHKSGKNYVLLLSVESERQAWLEALKPRLKRIHQRNPPSIQLSSLELQQAFETVLKVQRLGKTFGAASPFLGPTRPLSVDFSKFDEDKESLTGYLFVNIHNGKGFSRNSDTYVVLEMDSYGHFFRKAKTKPARGSDPVWEEAFEFEIEACSIIRLSCYNKLRLMGDDMTGKVAINLVRENLLDNRNHCLGISLDRGQGCMKISICFSTSFDGIKKTRSISESGVFGVPISIVCRREKSDIPVLVLSCIKEIEKRGMDEIGIYRLSGIASEIRSLKKLFNEQTQNALLLLPETDIHAVAGLLKLYFRELPSSLFTSKLYRKFVEGLNITDAEDKELYMCDILHQLPRCNLLTTLYLFEHLRRISLLESENKMGVNNLATVFGPTVLRPSSSDKENDQGNSCNVGTFDIGALDVMSQVGIFRYFLSLKNNERTKLPPDDLELWRKLNPGRAYELEEKLMETAEEFLI